MAVHWLARLALINQAYLRRHACNIKEEDIARAHAQTGEVESRLRMQKLLNSVAQEAGDLIALLRDYWQGRYTKAPKKVIGAAAFTIMYIVNPFDLIPDYLLGIGYLDDVAVVNVAYLFVRKDLEAYRRWRYGVKKSDYHTNEVDATQQFSEQILALPEPDKPVHELLTTEVKK